MSATNPFTSAFNDEVEKQLNRWRVPGVAFSVVHGDQTWSKGYGIARQPSTPVTPSTLFYVASTTKAQLCAAWAIYMESEANKEPDGTRRITWETPLVKIIGEEFLLIDAFATNSITLEDVVSHRSGIAPHELCYGRAEVDTPRSITLNLRNLPGQMPLRHHFLYCNIGYIAATYALMTVSGKTYSEALRDYLWAPLEMKNTYADRTEALYAVETADAVLAKPYTWGNLPGDADQTEAKEEEYLEMAGFSGAGAAISSADDYAKWMRSLLFAEAPLTPEIVKELWKPRCIVLTEDQVEGPFDGVTVYGLGWLRATYRGYDVLWHGGGVLGWGCTVILVPAKKLGITFLTNASAGGATLKSLAFWLVDELLAISRSESVYERVDSTTLTFFTKERHKFSQEKDSLWEKLSQPQRVPLTLPLEQYAGTYYHPGYGQIVFVNEEDKDESYLYASIDRVFSREMTLRHVSGEHWLGESWASVWFMKSVIRARSKTGADGKVEGFEIAIEPTIPETFMLFRRCG